MSARWTLAAFALIACPAAAQETEVPDAATLADQFEYALVAGDYRVLDRTEDFAYFENGAQLDPWDGMWRTTTALEGVDPAVFSGAFTLDYRVGIDQPDTTVRVIEVEENGVRGVMAYRLLSDGEGRIARIDVLPVREEFGGDRGGTITLLQPMLPFTMDADHVVPIDPMGRPDRGPTADATMRERIGAYLAGYAGGPQQDLAFTPGCQRFDNGQQATNVADSDVLDPAHPAFRPYALGCEDQLESGYYARFDPAEPVIYTDPARGLAIAFVRLDQPGTRLSFTTPGGMQVSYPGPRGAVEEADTSEQFDGRILTNMITPMSVNGAYVFSFDNDAIARIEAFYRGAPLGWDGVLD